MRKKRKKYDIARKGALVAECADKLINYIRIRLMNTKYSFVSPEWMPKTRGKLDKGVFDPELVRITVAKVERQKKLTILHEMLEMLAHILYDADTIPEQSEVYYFFHKNIDHVSKKILKRKRH